MKEQKKIDQFLTVSLCITHQKSDQLLYAGRLIKMSNSFCYLLMMIFRERTG